MKKLLQHPYIKKVKSILLENKTSKQTVMKNTFRLILAEWISKWSLALITIFIWRIFWTEIFGIYSYRWIVLAFLLVFADLWLTTLLIRDYQHLQDQHKQTYFSQWLRTKWILSLGVILVFWVILFISTKDLFIRQIWGILLFNWLINSFLEYLRWTFRSLQHSQVEFKIKLIQWIGNFMVIPFLYIVSNVAIIIFLQACVWFITLLFAGKLIHKKHKKKNHDQQYWIDKVELIKSGWVFAIGGVFVSMYYYVDSLIIQSYLWYEEVWIYNAAYRIMNIWILPLAIFLNSVFPSLRNLYTNNKSKFFEDIKFYTKSLLIWSMIIIPVWIFLSPYVIDFLFWNNYSESIGILQILIVWLWIVYINWIYWISLQATWNEKVYTYTMWITILVNIILNFIFIPTYWIVAAAYSTVITEIIMLAWMVTLFYKKVRYVSRKDLVKPSIDNQPELN